MTRRKFLRAGTVDVNGAPWNYQTNGFWLAMGRELALPTAGADAGPIGESSLATLRGWLDDVPEPLGWVSAHSIQRATAHQNPMLARGEIPAVQLGADTYDTRNILKTFRLVGWVRDVKVHLYAYPSGREVVGHDLGLLMGVGPGAIVFVMSLRESAGALPLALGAP